MDNLIERRNKIFDKQIKKDKRFKVHKELFNLTMNFDMVDWKQVRGVGYWRYVQGMPQDRKLKYLLERVKEYLSYTL